MPEQSPMDGPGAPAAATAAHTPTAHMDTTSAAPGHGMEEGRVEMLDLALSEGWMAQGDRTSAALPDHHPVVDLARIAAILAPDHVSHLHTIASK